MKKAPRDSRGFFVCGSVIRLRAARSECIEEGADIEEVELAVGLKVCNRVLTVEVADEDGDIEEVVHEVAGQVGGACAAVCDVDAPEARVAGGGVIDTIADLG